MTRPKKRNLPGSYSSATPHSVMLNCLSTSRVRMARVSVGATSGTSASRSTPVPRRVHVTKIHGHGFNFLEYAVSQVWAFSVYPAHDTSCSGFMTITSDYYHAVGLPTRPSSFPHRELGRTAPASSPLPSQKFSAAVLSRVTIETRPTRWRRPGPLKPSPGHHLLSGSGRLMAGNCRDRCPAI